MIINQLTLSDNLQEIPVNKGKAFPLSTHYVDLGKWRTSAVPWHWHSELEFLWLIRGSLKVLTAHQEYTLAEGEGCFVNRNVLHQMARLPKTQAVFLSQLWDVSLLGGARGSVFEQKYLNPVLESKEVEVLPFLLQNANQRKILEHIRTSCDAVDSETDGYEMASDDEGNPSGSKAEPEQRKSRGSARQKDDAVYPGALSGKAVSGRDRRSGEHQHPGMPAQFPAVPAYHSVWLSHRSPAERRGRQPADFRTPGDGDRDELRLLLRQLFHKVVPGKISDNPAGVPQGKGPSICPLIRT